MDPLSLWLIVIASVAGGLVAGMLFERTRGSAAKRAAKFEADLVQARSDLMRYQEQTKHHFGKSAELLGRMATDYRDFLDHFVTGAEELCGPNMKELNAGGLDRPLLERPVAAASRRDAAPSARNDEPPAADDASAAAAPVAMPPLGAPLDSDPLVEDARK